MSPPAALFLGMDGGGTKTEFVCIDADGRQLASSTTGTTYHLEIGFDEAVRRIGDGVESICRSLSLDTNTFGHVFFGLPAYGEDRTIDPRLNVACGEILGHERYRCGNDMVCGWAGSLACEDGINIVAGTGSIGYGERGGRSARAGGWGEVFGDEGSGYWIAIRGLAAFSRMSDGRLDRGPLHDRFRTALSLEDDIDLCARVMGPPAMSRAETAALSRLVSAAADDGDAAAAAILADAGSHLAAIALAVRQSLEFQAADLVSLSWSGSIFTQIDAVRRAFVDRLEREARFDFVPPRHPPGYGAALYARRLAQFAGQV